MHTYVEMWISEHDWPCYLHIKCMFIFSKIAAHEFGAEKNGANVTGTEALGVRVFDIGEHHNLAECWQSGSSSYWLAFH